MRSFVFFCLLFSSLTLSSLAQENKKLDFAFSAHYVRDFNWNKALDFSYSGTMVNINSILPMNYGLCIQKQIKKTNFSIGINYLKRNMEFTSYNKHILFFNYRTIELPLKISRRFRIDDFHNLYLGIGYGFDKVLTKTQDSKYVNIEDINGEDVVYNLYLFQPAELGHILKSNLCLESKLDNSSRIQFSFETSFSIIKNIRVQDYYKTDIGFPEEVSNYTNPTRTYYTMFGINYFPNFKCKK